MPKSKVSRKQNPIEKVQLQLAIAQLATTGVLLDTTQAAIYLGLAKQTLEIYRCKSTGPRCVNFAGSRPRYMKVDLDEWMASGHRRAVRV